MNTQQEQCGQNMIERDAYSAAIRVLNKAAYDAIRAGSDTTALPSIDRQSLRLIAGETDRLVDYEENSGEHPSKIKEAG